MPTPTILTDCVIGLAGIELSDTANNVKLSLAADSKDATTFKSAGWKTTTPGLASASFTAEGIIDYSNGGTDQRLYADFIALASAPVTIAIDDAPGAVAYLLAARRATYSAGAPIGELARYSIAADSDSAAARGALIELTAAAGRSGAAVSAAVLIPEGARLRAHVHVIAGAGTYTPTLDWARDGGGASGSIAGTAIAGVGAASFDVAWPDPGHDIDINIDIAASGGTTYRLILAAGATTAS